MKKKILFLITSLVVSLFALAEMNVIIYQKDGTEVQYLASEVDSIDFVNVFTIKFYANGGTGSMDILKVEEGATVTLPKNILSHKYADFTNWNTKADGSGVAYLNKANITPTSDMTLYALWTEVSSVGVKNGHEWVDLGLPSGTKWATTNLGATTPEDYGGYYAWGETSACGNYCSDMAYSYSIGPETLPLSNDAANSRWGDGWRMPTVEDFAELINTSYVTRTWTTQNGINGYKLTSKTNGNSIFLPAAGYKWGSDQTTVGSKGHYWSSSLESKSAKQAQELYFSSSQIKTTYCICSAGHTIRPVLR